MTPLEPLNDAQIQAWRDFVMEAEKAQSDMHDRRWDLTAVFVISAFTMGFVLGPGVLW